MGVQSQYLEKEGTLDGIPSSIYAFLVFLYIIYTHPSIYTYSKGGYIFYFKIIVILFGLYIYILYISRMDIDKDKVCTCDCHKKGFDVMHMMACCEHTYKKYINDDGSIDWEAYNG